MDKVRKRTDRRLEYMEYEIAKLYRKDPALKRVKREYDAYMSMVESRTREAYLAFSRETDIEHRQELKKVYMGQIEALTTKSMEYKTLIDKFTTVMADVNQQALDIVNAQMIPIYTENYNAVAIECRKVGIKVNGKEEKEKSIR